MSDTNKPGYRYSLILIELRESHIFPFPPPDENPSEMNFNVNLENAVHPEKSWIVCNVTVNIRTQKSGTPLGKLAASLAFSLEDFATHIHKNEQGAVILPPDLLATLNGIAISTTRGIMFGVFKGTPLHGALLPLMDVKAFAPELPLEGK
jgi:hypothetical protein